MQTKLVILASVTGGISALSFSTNQNILLSLSTALIASALYLAAYLTKDKKDKQIEEIHSAATSKHDPLKIIILNNAEIYKSTFEGEPVEWNKLVMALVSNPFFPEKLRATIQSQGIGSFLLIDLCNKKLIDPTPKCITDLKTKVVALVHKELLPDLPIEVRATILFKKYVEE